MTFSYDLETDVGKVRLEIGDTESDNGVKPNSANFSDQEIEFLIADELSVGRASARACEILARWYAPLVDLAAGPVRESLSKATSQWLTMAKELRRQFGGGPGRTMSVGVKRVDGYSKAAASDYVLDAADTSADYNIAM